MLNSVNRRVVLAFALLLLVAAAAVAGAFHFVAAERERALAQWQVRLGIVADSRAAAVTDWLDRQYDTLRALSENASLQLYLTELTMQGGDRSQVTGARAQGQYLANLLNATAQRGGFEAPSPQAEVPANVARVGLAGIALTDPKGKIVVASSGMPPVEGALAAFLAATPADQQGMMDMTLAPSGAPRLAFVQPIFAVQGDRTAADVVGRVVGVRLLGDEFFARLRQPGEVLKSAETYLVRGQGGTVDYLSPLADGTAPLKRRLARSTPDLAAAHLLAQPGDFGRFRDYRGEPVLATGRAIPQTQWTLIRKVDYAEALGDTERRLTTVLAVLIVIVLAVAAAIVAVWRHASSLRAAHAAERYRRSSERLQALSDFLRVVTDSQPTAIAAVDGSNRYTFANRRAADAAGIDGTDLIGKGLEAVLGPARARPLEQANAEALQAGHPVQHWQELTEADGGRRVIKSDHIPFAGGAEYPAGVLMVLEDMTELVRERERRTDMLRDLVNTCVSVVDQRDPFSAHHSARVAEVARAIAEEMVLEPRLVETCKIAGSLMNLGKVSVPRSVLTKTEALSEQELELVRSSILTSADMLREVHFDGPVQATIRQIQERWDGDGLPEGRQGEDILLPARIVAVANAFVGMVSSRAWRTGISFDEASRLLLEDAGKAFDRRVVIALVNHLDNHGGRTRWAGFGLPPEGAATT